MHDRTAARGAGLVIIVKKMKSRKFIALWERRKNEISKIYLTVGKKK